MTSTSQQPRQVSQITRAEWDEQLKGRPCFSGGDMMLMWDLAAYVLLFPWGRSNDKRRLQQYRLKPYFFIPEQGFELLAEHEPGFFNWRDRGYITVTDGNCFDEETYIETVLETRDTYDLRGFAYDPKYGSSVAQRLQDGHSIQCAQFNQNGITFAPCIDHMEKAISNRVMFHDGNPVMTFCARNVTLVERPGNLKLMKKPLRGNFKKIDGMVAATMAMGMLLSQPEITSIYEEEGALFG